MNDFRKTDVSVIRRASGLSIPQCQAIAMTTRVTWYRWETGRGKIPPHQWELFCRAAFGNNTGAAITLAAYHAKYDDIHALQVAVNVCFDNKSPGSTVKDTPIREVPERPTTEDIYNLRTFWGLSQADCANILGVTERAWYKWEQGYHMSPAHWTLFELKLIDWLAAGNMSAG
jgi:DNA-binding transcriptional regulator YiaG